MSLFTRNRSISHRSDHENTVNYASSRGERSFVAGAPANSRHAAQLTRIAMAVQEDKPRHTKKTSHTHAAISEGIRRSQIEYGVATPRPASAHLPLSHRHAIPREDWREPTASSTASATSMSVTATKTWSVDVGFDEDSYGSRRPSHYRQVDEERAVPSPAPTSQQIVSSSSSKTSPHVTRYATETRTAYQVADGKGTLYVSAPVGSNKARLFDAVAEAHSAQDQSKSNEQRELTRTNGGHPKRNRGSWW
ncbi:hypothetical protein F5Y14DRAFT_460829 [Nemania sp. NC0429]|nr:hypothetical protein F5Y14DRAFT_460829 [Nemania sp. NC0429]